MELNQNNHGDGIATTDANNLALTSTAGVAHSQRQPKKMTIASFFAGVGGIDLGFKESGYFETIYANEFDAWPVETFELNFPSLKVDCRDIRVVRPDDIPPVYGYVFGFPCQSFSISGKLQGLNDPKGRGTLVFEVLRLAHVNQPRFLFAENVKNLIHHDGGKTLSVILDAFEAEGYHVTWQVMNSTEYGNLPQNRERFYLVAFRDEADIDEFHFPKPVPLTKRPQDVIDFVNPVDDKYYYVDGRYKDGMYDKLVRSMDDPDAIYQWRRGHVRKNRSGVIPTLTANQGGGGHNVCLIKTAHGIRKMTPRECFNAQGFPETFVLPADVADSRLYKQAGNSVSVPVIQRIASNIGEAMQAVDDHNRQNAPAISIT